MGNEANTAANGAAGTTTGTGTGTAKRTFKPVGGLANAKKVRFVRPAQLAEEGATGEILEGIYRGPVASSMDDNKSDYKFETATEIVIINSNGSLAYKMSLVPVDSLVQVIYNGKTEIKSGPRAGTMAHSFDVNVATED